MKVLKIELPARDFVGVPEDDVGTIRGFPRSVFRNENEKILSIEESTRKIQFGLVRSWIFRPSVSTKRNKLEE